MGRIEEAIMKRIQAWKANDGTMFESETECDNYELNEELKALYSSYDGADNPEGFVAALRREFLVARPDGHVRSKNPLPHRLTNEDTQKVFEFASVRKHNAGTMREVIALVEELQGWSKLS